MIGFTVAEYGRSASAERAPRARGICLCIKIFFTKLLAEGGLKGTDSCWILELLPRQASKD